MPVDPNVVIVSLFYYEPVGVSAESPHEVIISIRVNVELRIMVYARDGFHDYSWNFNSNANVYWPMSRFKTYLFSNFVEPICSSPPWGDYYVPCIYREGILAPSNLYPAFIKFEGLSP
ncbi:117aa long hypothetical protein [Pyrococcus horikoshii OT3]|uniref:Uncharacterized protein n=1 Tax=Pyrococcus horikoshii (strain ATCC 700860 / DSM 12428 / JCM 9974 / NBRC 100139 / OT-3) TaxID=70601 RepID=O58042_PYRHO|nr:117aa long hypothetical protein [Pyrococcus horikoshii OT3]